jgi:hypothetical protein
MMVRNALARLGLLHIIIDASSGSLCLASEFAGQ